jgi:hypothetical protein
LSRIEYYQILWLNTIQGSRHRQTTKEDGESQYQNKKKSGFLRTIHNVPPYFFYFATEEREGRYRQVVEVCRRYPEPGIGTCAVPYLLLVL